MGALCGSTSEVITVYDEAVGDWGRQRFVGGPTWEWPTGTKIPITKITYSSKDQGVTFYHADGQIISLEEKLLE